MTDRKKIIAKLARLDQNKWRSICHQMAWNYKRGYGPIPPHVAVASDSPLTEWEWAALKAQVNHARKLKRRREYEKLARDKVLAQLAKRDDRKEYMRIYMQRYRREQRMAVNNFPVTESDVT